MSDDSDLEGKMSDTSIEEKKNEESNEQKKTIFRIKKIYLLL